MDIKRDTPWYRARFSQCLFVGAVIFQLTFAASFAFSVSPTNDEGCYVAILYKLMFQSTEGFCAGRDNYFAPGAPLLWLPAGLLALGLSAISKLWTFHWLLPVTALYSYVLFVFSLYFAFGSVNSYLELEPDSSARRVHPWILTLAVLLNSPILYYAGKWSVMPHTAQILTAFMSVYFLERRRFLLAGLSGILLSLTRFNDVPVVLMILGKAWDERHFLATKTPGLLFRRGTLYVLAAILIGLTGYVGWRAFVHGYGPETLSKIFLDVSLAKVRFFFLHDRWGVLWMTPWWVISIFLGLAHVRRLSNFARGALIWLLVEAYVAISWAGNGGDFGYRYLIGSFAAAWVVWKEVTMLRGRSFRSFFLAFTLVGSLWMTYLNIVYRSTNEFMPALVQMPGGPPGALVFGGLSHFLIEAAKHIFDPAVYTSWFHRDFPLAQLYTIWFELPPDHQVRGTDQLALGVATLGSLFYIIVFTRRNLQRRSRESRN